MITITKCPCGDRGCRDYHLVGIGSFSQGSGFRKAEAQLIAELLNENPGRLRVAQSSLTAEEREFLSEVTMTDGMELPRNELRLARKLQRRGLLTIGSGRGPGSQWHRVEIAS